MEYGNNSRFTGILNKSELKSLCAEHTVTCKFCKKKFKKPRKDWGWYIGDLNFCTYKCMRLYERAKKPKPLRG